MRFKTWWAKIPLPGGPLRPFTEERLREPLSRRKLHSQQGPGPILYQRWACVCMCIFLHLESKMWGKEMQEVCIIHMFGNLCVNGAAHSLVSSACVHTPQHLPHHHPSPPLFIPAMHMCCEYWSICSEKLIDDWLLIWSSQCQVQNVMNDKTHPIAGLEKRCKFRKVIWIRIPCIFVFCSNIPRHLCLISEIYTSHSPCPGE